MSKLNIKNLDAPESAKFIKSRITGLLEKGDAVFHSVQVRKDKSLMPVEIHARIISQNEQKLILSIARDTTERKKTEERLRESEKKRSSLFSAMNEGFCFHELIYGDFGKAIDYVILDANPAYESIIGLRKEQVIGRKASEVYGTLEPPYLELYAKVATTQEPQSFETYFPPLKKYFNISVFSPNKNHFATVFMDITEQKEAREELQKSALILQNSSDSIIVTDLRGKVTFWNKGASEIFGYTSSEIIGQSITKLLKPLEKERIAPAMLEQIGEGKTSVGEWEGLRKDGSTVWLILNTMILKNIQNEPVGLVGFGKDISERKVAEDALDLTMKKLVLVNEKLNVVGSLTRHDVRNKLSIVSGKVYLLKKKYADQPDILDGLNKIEQAVKDSVKIFEFAKIYEQLGIEELKYIDVENTLKEAVALLSDLPFKVINDCHGLNLFADSFLRQIFFNFIDNTRKYGKKTSAIRVYHEKAETGGLRLIYEDDGVGISAEDRLKLFKEGFSTGGSTGYGLFLSKKMIDVYGWQIRENGELGKGVKLVIEIPLLSSSGKKNYILTV
jgi:PAS domain S-box-containing protein